MNPPLAGCVLRRSNLAQLPQCPSIERAIARVINSFTLAVSPGIGGSGRPCVGDLTERPEESAVRIAPDLTNNRYVTAGTVRGGRLRHGLDANGDCGAGRAVPGS